MIKMDNSLISIIVPVYNTELYLTQCIDSIVTQTYTNLDIILINDGSTDNSGKICDEYADKDSRIRVIHNQNSGVSAARNVGLGICKGEYVAFIDSDDYVAKDFIEKLYRAITENEVDLSICGLEKIGGIDIRSGKYDEKFQNQKILLPMSGILQNDELWFHSIDSNLIGCYLCNKLFKKSLLHRFKLDTSLSIGEDMVYLIQYLLCIEKAYYIAEDLYKYRMNNNSAMNFAKTRKHNDTDRILLKIKSCMDSTKKAETLTYKSNRKIKQYISYRRIRSALWCIFTMIKTGVIDYSIMREIKNTVNDNYKNYQKVGYGGGLQGVAVNIIRVSPMLLFLLGRLAFFIAPGYMYKMSRL